MPLGVGYEQSGKQCLSVKGTVRHPGTFFRQAAGGAGGHRYSDHAALQDTAQSGHHLSGLLGRYDGTGAGKGRPPAPENVTFRQGDVGALPYADGVFTLQNFYSLLDNCIR